MSLTPPRNPQPRPTRLRQPSTRAALVAALALLLLLPACRPPASTTPPSPEQLLRHPDDGPPRTRTELRLMAEAEAARRQNEQASANAAAPADDPAPDLPEPQPADTDDAVVFLVDASGSMMDLWTHAVDTLRDRLHALEPDQPFTVIYFAGDRPIHLPPHQLQPAGSDTAEAALAHADLGQGHLALGGPANPRPALQRALAFEPARLVLITDGQLSRSTDADRLLTLLGDQAPVHVLQLQYRDRRDPSPLLQRIAQQTDGSFTFADPQNPQTDEPDE